MTAEDALLIFVGALEERLDRPVALAEVFLYLRSPVLVGTLNEPVQSLLEGIRDHKHHLPALNRLEAIGLLDEPGAEYSLSVEGREHAARLIPNTPDLADAVFA